MDKMQDARLEKLLDKVYRFELGTMSMRKYLEQVAPTHKTVSAGAYTVWFMRDGRTVGTDIPKIVWDSLDLPAEPAPVREAEPRRVYDRFVEMAALDMINTWYDDDEVTLVLVEGEAGESIPEIVRGKWDDGRIHIALWNGLNSFNGMTAGELRASDDKAFDLAVTQACEVIEECWSGYLEGATDD